MYDDNNAALFLFPLLFLHCLTLSLTLSLFNLVFPSLSISLFLSGSISIVYYSRMALYFVRIQYYMYLNGDKSLPWFCELVDVFVQCTKHSLY